MSRFADAVSCLTIMIAVCARASRAYSVGLRHAEEEVGEFTGFIIQVYFVQTIIAHTICKHAQYQCQLNLHELLNLGRVLRGISDVHATSILPDNKIYTRDALDDKIARFVLNKNSYAFDTPLQRNW
jgi:hypothetical protein